MTLINVVYAHTEVSGYAVHRMNSSVIWSDEPLDDCDIYAYIGAFSYHGRRSGLNVLLTLEPIVVLPGEYNNRVWQHFDYVLTFVDSLAEQGGRFHKIRFPAFDLPFTKTYLKIVDHSYVRSLAEKKNAICMISGNKKSRVPGELYSRRVEVAQWFNENSDIPFDVYGRPPFQLPNYRGELTPHTQKFVRLGRYRYSLCFENIYDPFWSKGYLSEKLLDCLMCETVPIYLGCYNVEEYVPRECFIDFRQFKELSELDQFLRELSDSEYETYIDHIHNWANEDNLSRFSMHPIYDKLLTLADPMVSEEDFTRNHWEPGLAADHAGRQWKIRTSSAAWTWNDLASAMPSEAMLRGEVISDGLAPKDTGNSSHQDGGVETVEMPAEKLQKKTVRQWFRDKGDSTLRLDYPLTEDSLIFDVGGYMGEWSQQIATRYNPTIYIFEPVPKFCSFIMERFKHNPKVSVFDFGLFDETKTETLVLDKDGSSLYGSTGEKIQISLVDIDEFLKEHDITAIDLMKINIEGAEYALLKRMIDQGIVERICDLQVQFHIFYPDAVRLRDEIRNALKDTHSLTYDYPFVWENWTRGRSLGDSTKWGDKRVNEIGKTILLSYPRSGSTWLRYCIEFLTKRLTKGYDTPGVTMENGLGRLVDIGVDCNKPPIVYKRHGHTPRERSFYDMDNDNLILLLRNYKECVVRHHIGKQNFEKMFYSQTQGYRNGSLDYVGCLQTYEAWRGKKLLIYYEDLISDPEPELEKVLNLLGADRTHLRELVDHLDFHRKQSVHVYAGENQTGGHLSYTKGDPDKLLFHSQQLSEKQKKVWDQHLRNNYPDITRKYLKRYQEPDISRTSGVIGIVFSKDRAMQLDATLRSFALHCKDCDSVDLKVLYTTSNHSHEQQYQQLLAEYESADFIRESNFKQDLVSLLSSYEFVLFLVDDNIFVRDFYLADVVESLETNPDAIGFSLRLGKNTTYCYMLDFGQRLPDFDELSHNTLKHDWTVADYDFGYPLELSSSVYRVSDFLPLLAQIEFSNPNTLELMLDTNKQYYKRTASQLLCYERSVTFCNPVNAVQALWNNKSGVKYAYSTQMLAEMFSNGDRIAVEEYSNMTPNSCHQEVELSFVKTDPLVSIVILNFNRLDDLRACLDSIKRNTPERHEIIIVDNASTDGSLNYLRTVPDITLVENPTNVGCPPARNQAMTLTKGDYVVFLDNDTIVTSGWLTTFVRHARRNPKIGLLGPRSNFVSGPQLVPQVPYRDLQGLEVFSRAFAEQNRGRITPTHRLVGFCTFIRRDVIDKIGAHDPQFGKFGFEDDDYTWRAIIAGFQAAIVHDVFVHHTGGPQVRGNPEYNRLLLQAWEVVKRKWELPTDLVYGTPYNLQAVLSQPFDPACHYVPPQDRSEVEPLTYDPAKFRKPTPAPKAAKKKTRTHLIIWSPTASADDLERCLNHLERFSGACDDLAVTLVSQETTISDNRLNAEAIAAPTPQAALQEALASEAQYVVLLANDVIVTKRWLDNLLSVADSDLSIGAIGPVSNTAPTPQRITKGYKSVNKELQKFAVRVGRKRRNAWDEVPYLGAFCLLLRTEAVTMADGLDENLSLDKALWDLYGRLVDKGFKLACAQGVYVHHAELTDDEGAKYDDWATARQAATQVSLARGTGSERFVNGPTTPQPGVLPEKPGLSVCMIVRDEEKALPRCLNSLKGVADELIVVDTGSKDNTIAIAKDFGAKVFHFKWCDDFAAARNESLKHATGEWILQLDADEELLPESIPRLKESMLKSMVLFYVIRCDNGPKCTRMRFHWFGRLFRRHPKLRYHRPYHEGVDYSVQNLIAEEPRWLMQYQPDIVIRHYGYDLSSIRNKCERGLPIIKSYVKENPGDWYMLARLGNTYFESSRFDEAEEYLKKALEINPSDSHANYYLGLIFSRQKRPDAAIHCYKSAVANDPHFAEAYAKLGATYIEQEMFDKAIVELQRALAINPGLTSGRGLLAAAHAGLGGIYVDRGMSDNGISELRKALDINPEMAIAYSNLGLAYIGKGMYDEAIVELKKALAMEPDLSSAHLNLGIAYTRKGMLEDGLRELTVALSIDPNYPKAHYNLAITYYMMGNRTEAIKHCNKAAELGIQIPEQLLERLELCR